MTTRQILRQSSHPTAPAYFGASILSWNAQYDHEKQDTPRSLVGSAVCGPEKFAKSIQRVWKFILDVKTYLKNAFAFQLWQFNLKICSMTFSSVFRKHTVFSGNTEVIIFKSRRFNATLMPVILSQLLCILMKHTHFRVWRWAKYLLFNT